MRISLDYDLTGLRRYTSVFKATKIEKEKEKKKKSQSSKLGMGELLLSARVCDKCSEDSGWLTSSFPACLLLTVNVYKMFYYEDIIRK